MVWTSSHGSLGGSGIQFDSGIQVENQPRDSGLGVKYSYSKGGAAGSARLKPPAVARPRIRIIGWILRSSEDGYGTCKNVWVRSGS